jgi:hypothetical protein
MSKIKFLLLIIVKIWRDQRENIVGASAIISTLVAIAGLGLKVAELQEKSQLQVPIKTETQAKVKPRQEVPVQAEAQLR